MASLRLTRALHPTPAARQCLRQESILPRQSKRSLTSSHHSAQSIARCIGQPRPNLLPRRSLAPFHTSPILLTKRAHNNEKIPDAPPTTDFSKLDVLGSLAPPSTSVDICMSDGFKLNSGISIFNGKGVMLVGGEAFEWQPWGRNMKLVNAKGQWEVPEEAFGLLELVWPRPDLLILGLGREMRPLSPAMRRYISSLGLRVEVLDTRNAASQFNLLATERGVDDVAAALIPIGWREGVGANSD